MSKKKIISLICACALVLTAIGGTLAYLTDKDKAENVFSVGSVDITLSETVEVNNGKTGDDKVVYANRVSTTDGVTTFSGLMPGNTIVKTPKITNSGNNAAYVRVVVTVNNKDELYAAIDNYYKSLNYTDEQIQEKYDEIFVGWGRKYNKADGEPTRLWMADADHADGSKLLAIDYAATVYDSYWSISKNNVFQTETEKNSNGKISSAGGEYAYLGAWNQDVYYYKTMGGMNGDDWDSHCYVFYLKLEAGESYEKFFDGLTVPTEFDADQLKGFNGLKIGVYADAIQTEGFTTWTDAINALEEQHPLGWWRNWN